MRAGEGCDQSTAPRKMRRLVAGLVCTLLLGACSPRSDPAWLGYAEGEDVFVAAPTPGWVLQVAVGRGQSVKPGDLLFTLDNTRERAARDQALANLANIKAQISQYRANLSYTSKELSRQARLVAASAGTQDTLDLSRSNYEQNLARITQLRASQEQAEAALRDASYQLAQRRVVSLVTGRIDDIYFRAGEYVPPATAVLALLPPQNVFVRFFVPEGQFGEIRLGQKVRIACDSCRHDMAAVVTFIAPEEEFTPPVIFSVGSREKLVFKLEARSPGGLALNPGGPVDVRPF